MTGTSWPRLAPCRDGRSEAASLPGDLRINTTPEWLSQRWKDKELALESDEGK